MTVFSTLSASIILCVAGLGTGGQVADVLPPLHTPGYVLVRVLTHVRVIEGLPGVRAGYIAVIIQLW